MATGLPPKRTRSYHDVEQTFGRWQSSRGRLLQDVAEASHVQRCRPEAKRVLAADATKR